MICELTNKLSNYICWFMRYGEDEKIGKIEPDIEVSIIDFAIAIMCASLITLILLWWWIPCVWLYYNIKWENINNVLYKNRFKCKKR